MKSTTLRVWDKESKKIRYKGFSIDDEGIPYKNGKYYHDVTRKNYDIKQYIYEPMKKTDLKDVNGKPIWESDIVEIEERSVHHFPTQSALTHMEKRLKVVKFVEDRFVLGHAFKEDIFDTFDSFFPLEDRGYIKVVGNIYEQPHLIKSKFN